MDIVNNCELANVPKANLDKKFLPKYDEITTNKRKSGHIVRKLEQTYIAIGFKTVGMYHPDYYTLNLLKYILTGWTLSLAVSLS